MPSVKEAAAAFLADQRVVVSGVSRNPQGPWSNLVYQRLRARGLDHAVWFHEPFRADDWPLYLQESPAASGARGLARGQVFRRDSRLVASVVQEGLIRVSSPNSGAKVVPRAADGRQPGSVTTGEPARKLWRIMTADSTIDGR